MLLNQNSRRQTFHCISLVNQDRALRDYRTAIESLVNVVDGAAADLHAMFQRLPLRVQSGKGRQQTWVDVQDALRKGTNELAVTFEGGKSASWALMLRSVELNVQYTEA